MRIIIVMPLVFLLAVASWRAAQLRDTPTRISGDDIVPILTPTKATTVQPGPSTCMTMIPIDGGRGGVAAYTSCSTNVGTLLPATSVGTVLTTAPISK